MDFSAEDVISSVSVTADDSYIKTAAGINLMSPIYAAKLPVMFLLILMIGVSAMRSILFPAVTALIFTVISAVSARKNLIGAYRNEFDKCQGEIKLLFCKNCFEAVQSGRTDRVFYDEISAVKKHSSAVEIKTKRGGLIIPSSDEFLGMLEKSRNIHT